MHVKDFVLKFNGQLKYFQRVDLLFSHTMRW